MKRIAMAMLIAAALVSCVGCKGGTTVKETFDTLAESTTAMSEVSGYRMSGSVEMGSGTGAVSGQSQVITMDIRADVQKVDGEMRQHMFVTIGGYEVEAYRVDGMYYQNVPGQGWVKSSAGAYQTQNMSLGFVDAAQMDIMVRMARDAEVFEENEETVGLSFNLDKEYFAASIDLFREYVAEGGQQASEEWLKMMEESITDFQADIRIWIRKADDLIQRMEIEYVMSGVPQVGDAAGSMMVDFFDYNEDIKVELPPEAAQAQ